MNALLPLRPIALAIVVLIANSLFVNHAEANEVCCDAPEPLVVVAELPVNVEPQQPSWVFAPSTFTHDPATGARVAQYMRKPPVEPLDDQRAVTSRYRRTRTNLRGIDGSYETDYQVQAWGNGRGGLDAEWERFHDAWKESYLSGGYYNGPGYGGYQGYGGGYPGYGYGAPGNGYGYPGYGYGGPAYGGPGYGFPPNGFPPNGHPPHSPGHGGPWHPHSDGEHQGDHQD